MQEIFSMNKHSSNVECFPINNKIMDKPKSDNCDKCFLSFIQEIEFSISHFSTEVYREMKASERRGNFTAMKSERWKLKYKNSINIKYFPSAESLFVLCFFIAARSLLSSLPSMGKKSSQKNDDKALRKNKFHGIFLALLLRKNCFVYEFAIHKTFSPFFCLFSLVFILENNVFCVRIASAEL